MPASRSDDAPLVYIGIFKLAKAALLIALGAFALAKAPDGLNDSLVRFARWMGAFQGREIVQRALGKVLALDEHSIHRLGVLSLAYAAVFTTEGVGLVLRRHWAEWLTVGVTGSFVPLEVYELARHPGAGKVVALAVNIVIVAYLVWRRVRGRHAASAAPTASAALSAADARASSP